MGQIAPISRAEYEIRVEGARFLMREQELDALLITSERNFRYLTGFATQFWVSWTRPWFFVLPLTGAPTAIIPESGLVGIHETSWVTDIVTWPSPRPEDEGVSVLAKALTSLVKRFRRVGAELGPESRLGMPIRDFKKLEELLKPIPLVDCSGIMRRLRQVKSAAEVERIREACKVASNSLLIVPTSVSRSGATERTVCTDLRIELLRRGADEVRYLVGVSGQVSYANAIMGPRDRQLEAGDTLYIDVGCTVDGYHSDFNRNWAIGPPDEQVSRVYSAVYEATEIGIQAARPGVRVSEVWRVMASYLEPFGTPSAGSRMGHAVGLDLTEPPSISATDDTVLQPGMVMCIEPGVAFAPQMIMLHEEDIVITEAGNELLTHRAPAELPVIHV